MHSDTRPAYKGRMYGRMVRQMALTAQPHITVAKLPGAIAGKRETATIVVQNVGTATGRWIIRGAIYDQAGHLIGSYVSQSISLPPGVVGTVNLTTNGRISSEFVGTWVGVVFTAESGSSNSASTRTEEFRLYVHAATSTSPTGTSSGKSSGTSSGTSPGTTTGGNIPTVPLPWYEYVWQNYKPEVIGGAVAVTAITGGLVYGHYLQRRYAG